MMNLPLVIIDARAPEEVKRKLSKKFVIHEFISKNITYSSVSGHPDIFIFQNKEHLVIAPNTPNDTVTFLKNHNVSFVYGYKNVGEDLANSTQYNCIATSKYLFHKSGFTDSQVLNLCKEKEFISIPQAYTRCSIIELKENVFLTSDKGIFNNLIKHHFDVIYISPLNILLPPHKNGFIGGCLGIYEDTLYSMGAFQNIKNGETIKKKIQMLDIKILELYDGPMYDGGGIFFIKTTQQ